MRQVFLFLAVVVAIVCAWGLIAPRSQWRLLAGWTLTDPHANEPGPVSYLIRRILFGVGLAGSLVVGLTAWMAYLDSLPPPPKPLTAIERMWGQPEPDLVNRTVAAVGAAPVGLVAPPILGFQEIPNSGDPNFVPDPPDYLLDLDIYRSVGRSEIPPGFIGRAPDEGFLASETADILVHVRGDLSCIPRAGFLIESETTVQVAIYYGLPDPDDGSVPDHVAGCSLTPAVSISLLIPIDLQAPLGGRELTWVDGSVIPRVAIIE